jgi:hypothetical protein
MSSVQSVSPCISSVGTPPASTTTESAERGARRLG